MILKFIQNLGSTSVVKVELGWIWLVFKVTIVNIISLTYTFSAGFALSGFRVTFRLNERNLYITGFGMVVTTKNLSFT